MLLLVGALTAIGAVSLADGVFIKAKAGVAQVLLERAWNETLAGEAKARPWHWADVYPVAKIEMARLNESAIALSGVSGEAMAFGPGVMEGAPAPGEPGLSIIAAHRDTHFQFLQHVAIGDEFTITKPDGERLAFQIVETRIVDANRSGLRLEGARPRVALVTCWPFDETQRGSARFVAIAELQAPLS
ncbi:MAG: class GN sortase [Pseudomonadota bacterium]